MGNASSGDVISRAKQHSLNQELWDNERKVEINRIFGNNLRNDIGNKKSYNFEKQHNDFLMRVEKEKFQRDGKYAKENKVRNKIFNDDHYFKKYLNNVKLQIGEESLNSSVDNIVNVNSNKKKNRTLPKMRNKSMEFNCRLFKK